MHLVVRNGIIGMKKSKRNSLIAGTVVIGVVAFLAYSIERSAQWTGTAYASIVVEVFDEEHNPMVGVRISLIDLEAPEDGVLQNATTNEFGIAIITWEFQASGLWTKRLNKVNIHTVWFVVRCEADGFEQIETRVVEHEPDYFDGDISPYVIPISITMHRIPGESISDEEQ